MKVTLHLVLWKYISDGNCDYFTLLLSWNPSTSLSLSGQNLADTPQSAVTSWKLTVETLEQGVKYVQN